MPVGDLGQPDRPRIGHRQLGAPADRLLHLHGDDRVGFGGVGSRDVEKIGVSNLRDRVGHGPGSERGHQTGDRGSVSRSGALMDIVRLKRRPRHLLHQVVLFTGTPTRADKGERVVTVALANTPSEPLATRSRASSQVAGRKFPSSSRTSGSVSRSS